MRKLEIGQSVKLRDNPNVVGEVVDARPGWAEVVHSSPRVIQGTRQWYIDSCLEALGGAKLQWELCGA